MSLRHENEDEREEKTFRLSKPKLHAESLDEYTSERATIVSTLPLISICWHGMGCLRVMGWIVVFMLVVVDAQLFRIRLEWCSVCLVIYCLSTEWDVLWRILQPRQAATRWFGSWLSKVLCDNRKWNCSLTNEVATLVKASGVNKNVQRHIWKDLYEGNCSVHDCDGCQLSCFHN